MSTKAERLLQQKKQRQAGQERHLAEAHHDVAGALGLAENEPDTTAKEQNSKGAKEQNFADAKQQNSKSAEEQNFALTKEQISASAEQQTFADAKQQNSKSAKVQNDDRYADLRRITFHIPQDLFRELKLIAAQDDMTMLEIGAQMAAEYIEKRRGDK